MQRVLHTDAKTWVMEEENGYDVRAGEGFSSAVWCNFGEAAFMIQKHCGACMAINRTPVLIICVCDWLFAVLVFLCDICRDLDFSVQCFLFYFKRLFFSACILATFCSQHTEILPNLLEQKSWIYSSYSYLKYYLALFFSLDLPLGN